MFCSRLWGGGKNLKVSDPIISEFSLSSDRHSSWMGLVFFPCFGPYLLFFACWCFIFIRVELIYNLY